MNERIKKLRKALDLTQQAFADRLGIKQNTIAKYETNRGTPTTSVVSLIVREFNVSEAWLRTGEGEMFVPRPTDALETFIRERGLSASDRILIEKFAALDTQSRQTVVDYVLSVADEIVKSPAPVVISKTETTAPAPPSGTDIPVPTTAGQERTQADTGGQATPDIMVELAELKRQNQELIAEIKAIKEEDALYGLIGISEASPGESVLNLNPNTKK